MSIVWQLQQQQIVTGDPHLAFVYCRNIRSCSRVSNDNATVNLSVTWPGRITVGLQTTDFIESSIINCDIILRD